MAEWIDVPADCVKACCRLKCLYKRLNVGDFVDHYTVGLKMQFVEHSHVGC